jgi:hypothetical protein
MSEAIFKKDECKMRTEISKSFDYGFTLDEQELRRIYDTAFERMKIIAEKANVTSTFKLKFKNGKMHERASLDEALSEENSGEWTIQTLTITLFNILPNEKTPTAIITVKFDAEVRSNTVNYNVLGNDRDWVYLTGSLLEDRIEKVKKFSPSSLGFGRKVSLVTSLVLSLIIGILSSVVATELTSSKGINQPFANLIIYILSIIILLAIGIIGWIRYYPFYNFYWGDYILTYKKRRAISRYILFVVIVTLLLSIIAVVIANSLMLRFNGGGSGG